MPRALFSATNWWRVDSHFWGVICLSIASTCVTPILISFLWISDLKPRSNTQTWSYGRHEYGDVNVIQVHAFHSCLKDSFALPGRGTVSLSVFGNFCYHAKPERIGACQNVLVYRLNNSWPTAKFTRVCIFSADSYRKMVVLVHIKPA